MLRQGDTGDWVGTFEGHKGAVWGVDLNRDATLAATGAADFSAKIWDATSGEERRTLKHRHIVKSVNFSADGSRLATGSNDKKLRIFDLAGVGGEEPSAEPVATFEGHESNIKQVLFADDGAGELLSCADDKTLRFWDARAGVETHRVSLGGAVGGMELSRDWQTLTVAQGTKVTFFDVATRRQIKEVEVTCPVYSASLLKEKNVFVCGGEDLKLYKFDYDTGKEIGEDREEGRFRTPGVPNRLTDFEHPPPPFFPLDSFRELQGSFRPGPLRPLLAGR